MEIKRTQLTLSTIDIIYKRDLGKFAYQFPCILNRASKFTDKFVASLPTFRPRSAELLVA